MQWFICLGLSLIFSKILHRNVPYLSLILWAFLLQLIPNIDVPYFSLSIFLLSTNQLTCPYHEQVLLSLMCQIGLGPVPFFQKICLASLTYCPLLNIMSVNVEHVEILKRGEGAGHSIHAVQFTYAAQVSSPSPDWYPKSSKSFLP